MVLDWFVPWHFSLTVLFSSSLFYPILYEVRAKWTLKDTVRPHQKRSFLLHSFIDFNFYYSAHCWFSITRQWILLILFVLYGYKWRKKSIKMMVLLSLGNLHTPSFATTFHCNSSSHNFVKFLPPTRSLSSCPSSVALEESRLWWVKLTFSFEPFSFQNGCNARHM